jgi:hypothetical protein
MAGQSDGTSEELREATTKGAEAKEGELEVKGQRSKGKGEVKGIDVSPRCRIATEQVDERAFAT